MGKAKLKVVIAMLLFGTIGVFVKNIALSSSETALYRGILGSLFLLIVLFVRRDRISVAVVKKNALILLLSGAGIGLNWIFLFQSFKYTTVSNATLSYYFAPVFVMLLSPLLLKEKLTAKKMGCIVFAMLGMYLIVGSGSAGGANYNHPSGIAYGLGAAVFYASVILLNKFLKNISGLESTTVQLMVASIVLAPYVLLTEGLDFRTIAPSTVPYLLILGIVHTGIAYSLYFSAMQNLKGQTIAVLSYIDPISAVLLSALFLGESMGLIQIIGGILVLGSTFISEKNFSFRKKKMKDLPS